MLHAANLKQWKDTLVMRCSIKISNSKSQSENTEDRQEMPSVRLWQNLQQITKLWWCKNFKVFRIDTKDEWKKMKEECKKWLDPKHETLYVVKEAICCMNIKFFFKQEREKCAWKVRCTRRPQSHIVSHRRSTWTRTQNWENQEAQLRVQLKIEELMMTSPEESFTET